MIVMIERYFQLTICPTYSHPHPKQLKLRDMKPIHAKPSLYANYFEHLKTIALKYGYNLVIHGSMNRDLDLIAIPWNEEIKPYYPMIEEFAEFMGGSIMKQSDEDIQAFATKFHGRINYVINLNRDIKVKYDGMISSFEEYADPQYYLDISITPGI